ncbi:MAG: hypothetical protein V3T70_00850 [Phycisphaerae bacterium]
MRMDECTGYQRVCWLLLFAAMLLNTGSCDVFSPPAAAPLAAAFGDPLAPASCSTAYHNDAFAFGFNPPADATGPNLTRNDDDEALFGGVWTTPGQRKLTAAVTNIGTTPFEQAVDDFRRARSSDGLQVVDDRPIAFDSGRIGWLLQTGAPNGSTETTVFDIRRGFLFSLSVDISGATTPELAQLNAALQSFCVDP